ncbi:MAG: hypothetical protein JRI87_07540 [Deltaproteobacteria bacterium]|nr:hypothetical protein [Deltaproteobacteria bacterium]
MASPVPVRVWRGSWGRSLFRKTEVRRDEGARGRGGDREKKRRRGEKEKRRGDK